MENWKEIVFSASGFGAGGVLSAAIIVGAPDDMRSIFSRVPKDCKGVNFEAVLKIDVIEGSAGHTQMIASWFW